MPSTRRAAHRTRLYWHRIFQHLVRPTSCSVVCYDCPTSIAARTLIQTSPFAKLWNLLQNSSIFQLDLVVNRALDLHQELRKFRAHLKRKEFKNTKQVKIDTFFPNIHCYDFHLLVGLLHSSTTWPTHVCGCAHLFSFSMTHTVLYWLVSTRLPSFPLCLTHTDSLWLVDMTLIRSIRTCRELGCTLASS